MFFPLYARHISLTFYHFDTYCTKVSQVKIHKRDLT